MIVPATAAVLEPGEVEDSLAQARTKVGQLSDDVREKTDEFGQRAQAVLDEQSGRLSSAVKAGKKAVRDFQG